MKNNEVRYFSKIIWFIICLISVPLGGIAYFVIGRKEEYDHDEEIDRTI
ncbi:PLDc N-terminal domain-containing protein [Streptococcus pneumoniae]|nr:PLDc N-terminal domain-containing protein [Streptococcus pneumoniae]MBU8966368.1 PLDc N-terminal domain-containing protein [Streptococcus pneumoniae]MDG7110620.1 PLDc N-terminal domain-containing protein [Streptococcus pneumoniae]MDG7389308.1 PLDc N-terminal domain-containing protein [Streptococcus pneumoniae]MDH7770333.1 PLDc N-terminal domain-containing protein [Streptococcus pneumoniae]HES9638189.1 PLDc N-terminal domain-containing protein [Streptococcus pneumoniae]